MTTRFAGQYGPEAAIDIHGEALLNGTVEVYDSNGTTASTLWTDRTKATALGNNIVSTGVLGNFTFFAEPGLHVIKLKDSVGTLRATLTVSVLPDFLESMERPGLLFFPVIRGKQNPTSTITTAVTTDTVVYTCPAGKKAVLQRVEVFNNTGSTATVKLYIDSAVAANQLAQITVNPNLDNQQTILPVLGAGQTLRVVSDQSVNVLVLACELESDENVVNTGIVNVGSGADVVLYTVPSTVEGALFTGVSFGLAACFNPNATAVLTVKYKKSGGSVTSIGALSVAQNTQGLFNKWGTLVPPGDQILAVSASSTMNLWITAWELP